jgi:hypothetical protein
MRMNPEGPCCDITELLTINLLLLLLLELTGLEGLETTKPIERLIVDITKDAYSIGGVSNLELGPSPTEQGSLI